MEVLLLLLLVAIIAILSQAAGVDSRDAEPRCHRSSW